MRLAGASAGARAGLEQDRGGREQEPEHGHAQGLGQGQVREKRRTDDRGGRGEDAVAEDRGRARGTVIRGVGEEE